MGYMKVWIEMTLSWCLSPGLPDVCSKDSSKIMKEDPIGKPQIGSEAGQAEQ